MAKIRRVVRKLSPTRGSDIFDDQFWPINVALFVLGGFLVGMVLANMRFDAPEWYLRPWLWLVSIPFTILGLMFVLRFVSNRLMRRSLQLAFVTSIVVHIFIVIITLQIYIPVIVMMTRQASPSQRRQPVTIPDHVRQDVADRQERDFERPVDVDTPEPEPEPIEREEPERESDPLVVQPTPVPEPEQTIRPKLVRRETPRDVAPRLNQQASRLSRQESQATTTPKSSVATPRATQAAAAPAKPQASRSEIQRQNAPATARRQPSQAEPSTETTRTQLQVSRRADSPQTQPQTTASPTVQRQTDTPRTTPRTPIVMADTPSVSRRSEQPRLSPSQTNADKRQTAAPEVARKTDQPASEAPTEISQQTARRQLRTEQQPSIARTPTSVPNQRTRVTTRAQVTPSATAVTPTPNPTPPSERLAARDSSVSRQVPTPTRPRPQVASAPPSTAAPSAARMARRETDVTPDVSQTTQDRSQRRTATNRVTAQSTPAVANSSNVPTPSQPLTATPVETQRQTTANALANRQVSPSPAEAPSPSTRPATSATRRRQPQADNAPQVAQNTQSAPNRRSSPVNRPNVATLAANPSQVTESSTASTTANVDARTSPVPQANTTSQVSRVQRSSVTNEPAIRNSQNRAAVARRDLPADSPTSAETSPQAAQRQATAAAVASATNANSATAAAIPTLNRAAQIAARSTAASRLSDATATLSQAVPSAVASNVPDRSSSAAADPIAGRRPRADAQPEVAQSTAPATQRASFNGSRPSSSAVAGNVSAPREAATGIASSPSSANAAVSRQSAPTPSATRNQPALSREISGAATQLARADTPRAQTAEVPSVNSQAPNASPQRTETVARTSSSPTQAESPTLAQATEGAPSSAAEPARTALNQALNGVAGVGAARNLQHSPPTTDRTSNGETSASVRSALQASAAAHRAEASQQDTPGPALTPSAVAQVRRTQTMADVPSATLPARPVETADARGSEQPAELNASSSAALTQADSNAQRGEISAAKGSVEVDLGPTRLVSSAEVARQDPSNLDGGGGQPTVNLDTQAPPLARREIGGGAPQSIVARTTAESVAAPSADGGRTTTPEANLDATAIARSDSGADQPISGGPAQADKGPTSESQANQSLAQLEVSRASQAEAMSGPDVAGGGDPTDEDEEERLRRLARAAGGAPRVAVSALTVAATPSSPKNDRGGTPPAVAAETTVSRAASGAPLAGGPSAQAEPGTLADVGDGPRASQATMSRSQAAEAVPGSPTNGGGQPDSSDAVPLSDQLARSASGGGPQRSVAGPTTAEVSPAASSPAGGAPIEALADASPAASSMSRTMESTTTSGSAQPATMSAAAAETASPAGGDLVAAKTMQRAEAVEGDQGSPVQGGGTSSPTRTSTGPQLVTDNRAAVPAAAGSSGVEQARQVEASGSQLARRPGGLQGPASTAEAGARAGKPVESDQPGQPGNVPARRRNTGSGRSGPLLAQNENTGGPLKQGARFQPPSGANVAQATPSPVGDATRPSDSDMSTMGDLAASMGEVSPMAHDSSSGSTVQTAAPEGPGGLAADLTPDVGLNSRRAQTDQVQIHTQPVRFVREEFGGRPSSSAAAVVAADPFRRMQRRGGGTTGGRGAADPQTERAIEQGLAFLTRYQAPDGGWSLQAVDNRAVLVSDTAATALALLAFQGAGYNHKEHKYADVVNRGLQKLLKTQVHSPDKNANGDLFHRQTSEADEFATENAAVRLYSHAIATLALCEAYGMTQDPDLKDAAQDAIDFIQNSQHAQRGGWRYKPGQGADTSVTGWMMMALKSGELANLKVRNKTFTDVNKWLDKSQASASKRHLYRYNPYAPETDKQAHGRVASKTMTSVGLLMRLYNGWGKDNEWILKGAGYLAANPPSEGTVNSPQRDTYYWYYATQVMFHMGGDYWERWNAKLHPLLVSTQFRRGPLAGSWDPYSPVPDRWAPHAGRLYVTTMNLLSLEVHYRHLPLYEKYQNSSGK